MYFLGVDGGMSGAMAVVDDDGALFELIDTPSLPLPKSDGGTHHVLDWKRALSYLRIWPLDFAFFEKGQELVRVGNDGQRRRQSGMYDYGFTNGTMFGLAVAVGHKCSIVTPQDWKRSLHLLGRDKDASRDLATELWPGEAHRWKAKTHHNRAEAALIALYCHDEWNRGKIA